MKFLKLIIFLGVISFLSLACSKDKSKGFIIGMDRNWYGVDLEGQQADVNGFMQDLLLTIAKNKHLEINLVDANWDSIVDNLNNETYEAIFSNLPKLNFNLARYSFSKDIIETGYVIVVSENSKFESFKDLEYGHVGYMRGSDSLEIIQKYPLVFDVSYDAIPAVLDDVVEQKLDAAVISQLPAIKYLQDLYQNKLKIVYPQLNDDAIRLVTLKDQHQRFLNLFNEEMEKYKEDGTLQNLKKKWNL